MWYAEEELVTLFSDSRARELNSGAPLVFLCLVPHQLACMGLDNIRTIVVASFCTFDSTTLASPYDYSTTTYIRFTVVYGFWTLVRCYRS